MEKELKTLNNLLLKHEGNNYEEFSVCLEHLFLPKISFGFISRKKKSEVKMSFNFLVNFLTTVDKNGSMTWTVTDDKISILIYFNDENIDLKKFFCFWIPQLRPMDLVLGDGSFCLWCRCPVLNIGIMIVLRGWICC